MMSRENDGRFGVIPVATNETEPQPEDKAVINVVRTDGQITGYVLPSGLKITKEKGTEMAKLGKLYIPSVWH